MPSAGIEFVTEVGAHFPDFVQSGLEMHTNIYHESGVHAKVSVSHNNVKLTIPAPEGPTKLVSLTYVYISFALSEVDMTFMSAHRNNLLKFKFSLKNNELKPTSNLNLKC